MSERKNRNLQTIKDLMDTSNDKIEKLDICAWLRRGNFKSETECLLIGVQNNAIRINYVKAKIDKTQQNINVDYV